MQSQNSAFKDFVSTDKFTEMVDIEKEFGKIDLGIPSRHDPRNNWGPFFDIIISGNKALMEKLLIKVDRAKKLSDTELEVEKAKRYQSFRQHENF